MLRLCHAQEKGGVASCAWTVKICLHNSALSVSARAPARSAENKFLCVWMYKNKLLTKHFYLQVIDHLHNNIAHA